MKPIHTLTWALSAPILLFASASQAATFSFSDANCSSFNIDSNGVISCISATTPTSEPVCSVSAPSTAAVGSTVTIAASCNPAATSYAWTGTPAVTGASTVVTFPAAGDYTYTVTGTNAYGSGTSAPKTITVSATEPPPPPPPTSSCPTPPAGTVIVAIGGKDNYAGKDFDVVFDNPGATFDSAVAAGQSKALEFTDANSLVGYLYATTGNYGGGYKDFALSLCPGDFTASLGAACAVSNKTSLRMTYSTDGSLGCKIPANQPLYLNVRGADYKAAGWVIQNVRITAQ